MASASAPATKSATKSTGKNPVPGNVPFQRGHDPRRGHGPAKGAPNAGRPPDKLKARAEEGLGAAVEDAIAMVKGEAIERIVLKDGTETETKVSVAPATRIRAGEFLGKVAGRIGQRLEIEGSQTKPLVFILEQPVIPGKR